MSNPLVLQVDEALGKVEHHINRVFDGLNAATRWFPELTAAIHSLHADVKHFWEWIGYYWINRGDEDKLKKFAKAWEERVGDVFGDLATNLAPPTLKTNDTWRGSAATAYNAMVEAQVGNLTRLREFTDQVRTSLDGLAGAIHKFCKALLVILTQYAVAMAGCAIAACTGVGAPPAAGAAAAATGVTLASFSGLVTVFSARLSMFISLQQAHTDAVGTIDDQTAALQRKANRLTWNQPDMRLLSGDE